MSRRRQYTKADLEKIVYTQLDNLNAVHDLLRIMKVQNELLTNLNTKLKDEVAAFKAAMYPELSAPPKTGVLIAAEPRSGGAKRSNRKAGYTP